MVQDYSVANRAIDLLKKWVDKSEVYVVDWGPQPGMKVNVCLACGYAWPVNDEPGHGFGCLLVETRKFLGESSNDDISS